MNSLQHQPTSPLTDLLTDRHSRLMALFKTLPQKLLPAQPIRQVKGLVYGLALLLGGGAAAPGLAAERLTVRLGPIEQSVTVSDLEEFAATGDIPPSLSLYAPLLTEDVRQALNSRIQLDPEVGDRLVDDLLQSSAGRRLLSTLEVAIPNSTVEDLEAALTVAAQQVDGLSLLAFAGLPGRNGSGRWQFGDRPGFSDEPSLLAKSGPQHRPGARTHRSNRAISAAL
ncbi:MAG: alpha/beta hydrolase [Leptolyngbyaceae cyanobacterium SM1_4_3]|nr:alpha/beta hydrolase [Leptolyngbyaceae cyanobacterium SM1_4_3]